MVNGVLLIVAAVLFAVISIQEGINLIWMGIAGTYLLAGVINLSAYWLKVKRIEKAAQKAEKDAARKAEQDTVQKPVTIPAPIETTMGD